MEPLTADSKEIQELQKQLGDEFTIDLGILTKNQSDPAFYCEGYGHSFVASITDNTNKNTINIFCDGEMRINYEDEYGNINRITNCNNLLDYGINTEQDLASISQDSWGMNPWFDLYFGDEWLDVVHFDAIKEGFPIAKDILVGLRGLNE